MFDRKETQIDAPIDKIIFYHAGDDGLFYKKINYLFNAGLLKNGQAESLDHTAMILFFHNTDHIFYNNLFEKTTVLLKEMRYSTPLKVLEITLIKLVMACFIELLS